MSHPNDGDRFTTPEPEEGAWSGQPPSQPEAPQFGAPQYDAPQYGTSQHGAAQSPASAQQNPPAATDQAFPTGSAASQQNPPDHPSPGPQGSASQPSPAGQGSGWAPAGQKGREANFFKAMVDFKFDHFITVKFSTFLYVLAFLVAGLLWIGQIICGILFGVLLGSASGFYDEPSFNAIPLVLAILFGWIPSVIALVAMRLGLEFSVATIRTAQNTGRVAEVAEHGR